MQEAPEDQQDDTTGGASPASSFIFHIPGAFPRDESPFDQPKRDPNPACCRRYGRGGRCWLEARKSRTPGELSRGVVSDSDSEDEHEDYYNVDAMKYFEFRCWLNARTRPDGISSERRTWSSGDQSGIMARRESNTGPRPPSAQQQQAAGAGGGTGSGGG